jgi:hypothetical protein
LLLVGGRQAQRVIDAGIGVETPTILNVASKAKNSPAYTYIPDMAYQAVRDGYTHSYRAWRLLKEIEGILKRFRPDVLVGDGFLLAGMLGQKVGLPVAQVVKSVVHPVHRMPMATWEPVPAGLILPDVRQVFNPVLRWLQQPEIENAAQLLKGDLYIMAGGIPSLDPLAPVPEHTFWPGPIIRQFEANDKTGWESAIPANRPIVYATIGGATSLGGWNAITRLLFEALGGQPYTVVFSTGGRSDIARSGLPDNFYAFPWLPTRQMVRRSQAVIFPGGYTRLEILIEGRPSVVLPTHSEQEYYGRLMADEGAARVLSLNDSLYHTVMTHWRAGRLFGGESFPVYIRPEITLPPGQLRLAVEEVLDSERLRSQAERLKVELEGTGGCEDALNRIIQLTE